MNAMSEDVQNFHIAVYLFDNLVLRSSTLFHVKLTNLFLTNVNIDQNIASNDSLCIIFLSKCFILFFLVCFVLKSQ